MIMKRRLACCTRDCREVSLDFDEQNKIMTYNGLESCILDSHSYDNDSGTSRGDGCATDSFDEDASSCSSSNNAFGSFSSHWTAMKRENGGNDEWEFSSPQNFYVKEKSDYKTHVSDVDTMKEKFSKLLLGEDITGGAKGISTALALSNAITNLAASVFGELWKLEPLPEERKIKWRREMDWMISPTNYMVELVPAKQSGSNGRTLEIMTPKVRADIHMNLPALQKLDTMLIGTLDSMVNTEFWYAEVGSRAEGRSWSGGQSKRWWLPYPRVPAVGLSDAERKKLLNKGKLVHQVFKAAKSINENVLLEMHVPATVRDALPKTAKASLGEELYKVLASESISSEDAFSSLNLKSEHGALETVNRLEAAIFLWKEKIIEQNSVQSPVRTSWSLIKDPVFELEKMEYLLQRAESMLQLLKSRYPNLPQTFLEVVKVQYGKDVGHSILEAYSRVLANLAYSILTRIRDILQEDILSNPNSPAATCQFPGLSIPGITDSPKPDRVRHSLIDRMNKVDGHSKGYQGNDSAEKTNIHDDEHRMSSVTATSSHGRVWCIGREACGTVSTSNSP